MSFTIFLITTYQLSTNVDTFENINTNVILFQSRNQNVMLIDCAFNSNVCIKYPYINKN